MELKDLKFTKTHEWLLIDGDTAKIGITDYAQHQMGDIVYVDLPEVDDEVEIDESICEVESVKAVSEILSPVDGTIVSINEDLEDAPEKINSNPYDAWIVEVKVENLSDDIMSYEEYEALDKE